MCRNTLSNTNNLGITLHTFPKDIALCNEWATLCHRFDLVDEEYSKCFKSQRLCSVHFEQKWYHKSGRLMKNAIPSIFSWNDIAEEPRIKKTIATSNLQYIDDSDISGVSRVSCSSPIDLPHSSGLSMALLSSPIVGHTDLPSCSSIPLIPRTSTSSCSTQTAKNEDLPCTSAGSSRELFSSPVQFQSTVSFSDHDTSSSSCSTQTPKSLTRYTPRKKNLREKYDQLLKEFRKFENTHDASMAQTLPNFHAMCDKFLDPSFSKFVKLQSLLKNKKDIGRRYTDKLKELALTILFLGPKVYRFLRKTWCLPSIRTLQRVTESWEIYCGLNNFIFEVLKLKSKNMTNESKQCVLCIDEMSLKCFLYYHIKKDVIHGLHHTGLIKTDELATSVMVIMIRGLNDTWKQPLVYFFVGTSCVGDDLKNIIFNSIIKLHLISFDVKVLISDLGSNFKRFATTMGVSPSKPYFNVHRKEVMYMFDPPHLLKATRNHFFSYRFQSGNKIAEKFYLQSLFDTNKNFIHRLAPKLTDIHLNPNSYQKLRVKYASQVMSHTVAASLETLVAVGKIPSIAQDTIDFIDSIDKLFDLFNSHISSYESDIYTVKPFKSSFKNLSFQSDFLLRMTEYFTNLKILKYNPTTNEWNDITHTYNIKFIYGWLVSIAGLLRLHKNISEESNRVATIYTSRLNQDCLENFFGTVRTQNGNCINPSPIQFERTFKKLFCLNYFQHSENTNCIDDLDSVLARLDETDMSSVKLLITGNNPIVNVHALPVNNIHYHDLELPEQNAFTYICGYLMAKCLKYHSCDTCIEYANESSELTKELFFNYFKLSMSKSESSSIFGSLVVPSSEFYNYISEMNNLFNRLFKTFMLEERVGQKLKLKIIENIFFIHPCDSFPKEFQNSKRVNLFIRYKIYNTLNRTNKFY